MKRKFTIIPFLAVLAVLASCGEKESVEPELMAIDKAVSFEIFAHKAFSTSYFADHEATIRLSIKKVDSATMAETVVFDTVFTKPLKDVPLVLDKMVIREDVPGVVTEKEWVSVHSGFSVGQEAYFSSEFLPVDKQELKVEVAL